MTNIMKVHCQILIDTRQKRDKNMDFIFKSIDKDENNQQREVSRDTVHVNKLHQLHVM